MAMQFAAIYEEGRLRPLQPLPLAEGAQVEIIVLPTPNGSQGRTPAELLAAIAALPLESDGTEFSGREHDRILYGK